MQSHEVDYEILGHDIQLVEIELDPEETVIAEAGALAYMEPDIAFETRMGDGADPEEGIVGKLFGAGKRLITGESLFMTHFTNNGDRKRKVAFSAPTPGSVLAINLEKYFVKRTRFWWLPGVRRLISLLVKDWGPGSSVEKVLSCKSYLGMVWRLFMPGARWSKRNCRVKPCASTPVAW